MLEQGLSELPSNPVVGQGHRSLPRVLGRQHRAHVLREGGTRVQRISSVCVHRARPQSGRDMQRGGRVETREDRHAVRGGPARTLAPDAAGLRIRTSSW